MKGATAVHASQANQEETALMPILKARVIGENGKRLELNVMLDQCSGVTLIRDDVNKELNLKGPRIPMDVNGIGGLTDREDRNIVSTKLYSRSFSNEVMVNLATIPVICKPVTRPAVPSTVLSNKNLRNLYLADDYTKEEEREIHILIGWTTIMTSSLEK